MKKGKSITLLSIIGVIMAFLIVMTFARFPVDGGVKNYNSVLGAIELDYDVAGGTAYTVTLAKDNLKDIDNVDDVVDTMEARLDALGYKTYSIKAIRTEGKINEDYQFRIEARGAINDYGEQDVTSLSADIQTVCQYGVIKFYGGTSSDPTEEILTDEKVIESAVYDGISTSSDETTYLIKVTFTDYGYNTLMDLLNANSSYYLKISLGDETLLSGSSAISSSYFSGKSLAITSSTEEGAVRTALLISSGGMEYKFNTPVEEGEITSPYGNNISKTFAISFGIAFVLVIVAFCVFNKGLGISLGLSSILFILLDLIMFIAVPGIKISLGGLIGIVISTIVLFDGQVILAKRIKEEYAMGKTVKSAIKNGYRRSLLPTISVCFIAGIIGLCSFIFGHGTMICFGITLGIGSVIAGIANLIFVRMFNSLILPIAGYKEKYFGYKRDNSKEVA